MDLVAALTGTPGTGKTTVAEQLDLRVIDLNAYTHQHDLVEADGSVDVRTLDTLLQNDLLDEPGTIVLEGHLGHHLGFLDVVVVLRCRPTVLVARLKERDWGTDKIRENAEAEALGLIATEAQDRVPHAYEIETSDADIGETVAQVEAILAEPGAERFEELEVGWVDHLDEVLEWY